MAIITATGGTITYLDSDGLNPRSDTPYEGGYTVHTFTSTGTFSVTSPGLLECLIVGGGGGAGYTQAYNNSGYRGPGGGGGGGVIYYHGDTTGDLVEAVVDDYSIVIGAKGVGRSATPDSVKGGSGGDSSAFSLVAKGGGGGGSGTSEDGADGGCGGGVSRNRGTGDYGSPGQSTQAGSYSYGTEGMYSPGGSYAGSGGGGATEGGLTQYAGGAGLTTSISGASTEYAKGGSQIGPSLENAVDQPDNTGHGGDADFQGVGDGGSGIVIIRYRDYAVNVEHLSGFQEPYPMEGFPQGPVYWVEPSLYIADYLAGGFDEPISYGILASLIEPYASPPEILTSFGEPYASAPELIRSWIEPSAFAAPVVGSWAEPWQDSPAIFGHSIEPYPIANGWIITTYIEPYPLSEMSDLLPSWGEPYAMTIGSSLYQRIERAN